MVTRLKLNSGSEVIIEQTMTAIRARYAWETESRVITTEKYMALVENSTPIGDIK